MNALAYESCPGCGAPLGADQRYCLSCGVPRAGARLPFLDVLHAEASSAGVIEGGSQPAALLRIPALPSAKGFGSNGGSRSYGWGPAHPAHPGEAGMAAKLRDSTGLFALLGVLLLALLIGLLLGHWVSGGPRTIAAAPSRQVIEVKGLALPTAAAAGVGGSSSSGVAGSTGGGAASEPASASASAPSAGETTSAASVKHATHASNPTVSSLAKSTGKEHAKEVENALSKGGGSLSTGGAPPPQEKGKSGAGKPIGGGSEVTSIE